ncbi:MAG: response regulator transcription factor [Opitutaceae bacterium]
MPKVLLVDDDAGVRSAVTRALQVEGFRVSTIGDAAGVPEVVEKQAPDIVLLDLGLGAASGWDVFEELSRDHPLIPIIIITARSAQFEVAKLAGVSAFVEKPIEIPQLVATMRQLLAEDADTRMARLALRSPAPRFVRGRLRGWGFPRSLN